MRIQSFARCAALAALLVAPLAASADNDKYDHDKDKTSDESQKDKDRDKKADEAKPDKTTDKKVGKLSETELQVLAHVHRVNQTEIDMGKLAQKKGSTAAVRDYGKMLVKDHGQSDKDLRALAKKEGAVIPKETIADADKQEMKDSDAAVKKMRAMKGAEFDRQFLDMMVQDHEKELVRADSAMASIQDPDLQSFVKDLRPVLQRHVDQARDLQKASPQASLEDKNEPTDQTKKDQGKIKEPQMEQNH